MSTTRFVQSIYMDFRDEIESAIGPLGRLHSHILARLILGYGWYILHLFASIIHIVSHFIRVLEYYIIATGLLKKYRKIDLRKLQYLAIVVDGEEASNTTQIKKLLRWLSDMGVKYVMLYDMEGLLKKTLKVDRSYLTDSFSDNDSKQAIPHIRYENMTIELLSSYDGKEAVAKAASFICSNKTEFPIAEADVSAALKAVGHDGPEPNLLLVYGPARCHLGFPAWRMRYTEIVHMGLLKSMKYGAILKVMYDFSHKNQNYGT